MGWTWKWMLMRRDNEMDVWPFFAYVTRRALYTFSRACSRSIYEPFWVINPYRTIEHLKFKWNVLLMNIELWTLTWNVRRRKDSKVVRVIKLWLFFVEFSLPIFIPLPSRARKYFTALIQFTSVVPSIQLTFRPEGAPWKQFLHEESQILLASQSVSSSGMVFDGS